MLRLKKKNSFRLKRKKKFVYVAMAFLAMSASRESDRNEKLLVVFFVTLLFFRQTDRHLKKKSETPPVTRG